MLDETQRHLTTAGGDVGSADKSQCWKQAET